MKTYLDNFRFPGYEMEDIHFRNAYFKHMTCFNNYYPFAILPPKFKEITFEPITILYGGNGSGKTTILNIIAETLKIRRKIKYNKSSFFGEYIGLCDYHIQIS